MGICSYVNSISGPNSCPFPSKLQSKFDYDWKSKTNEWSNTVVKPASLLLVLSWTPTYCESLPPAARQKEFQCSGNFNMIVHGLWPQAAKASSIRDHPRNCRNEKQLNSTLIKRFFCLMPDEYLMQAEWEKHGSCHYKTAHDYFLTIENLYQSLNIPNIQSIKNLTATNVKNSFLTSNKNLPSSAIQVSMSSSKRLQEIKICYDLNNQFRNCYS